MDAVSGPGWTIVVHPGTYREVVNVPAEKTGPPLRGASRDPRAAVIVHGNAGGTPKPRDQPPPATTFLTTGSTTIGASMD